MKKLILAFLTGAIILSSCKKTTVEPIYEVRLTFPFTTSLATNLPEFRTLPTYTHYIDFDKKDYPKMDSITLNAALATDKISDSAVIRLFNVTDGVVIENSTTSASTTNLYATKYVQTNNIAQYLPDKKITLAVQMKGVGSGYVSSVFLKLRRS